MIYTLLAHVTISSLSQYMLAGLIGLAAGLSITILSNPSSRERDVEDSNQR